MITKIKQYHISNLHRYTNIMCRHPRAIIWFRSKGRDTGSDSQEIFEGGTLNVASRSGNRRLSSIFERGCCSAGCLTPAIKSLSRIFYVYLKHCKILPNSFIPTISQYYGVFLSWVSKKNSSQTTLHNLLSNTYHPWCQPHAAPTE
jgi:hypothetical protein